MDAIPTTDRESREGGRDSTTQQILSAELERALLQEIVAEWKNVNATYFRGALSTPIFELMDSKTHLGRWHATTRTIELSRPFVLTHSWRSVLEVLKHEIAHQYAHEVLAATDETAHGHAFRRVCAQLGIDSAASGVPEGSSTESTPEHRIVERIARLLALAESPNVHEAEAATNAAQRLMLKYNIDILKDATRRSYEFRILGKPTGRVAESERMLAVILARHFFVEVIWVSVYRPLEWKRGSVLEVCGTPANLTMAEYVYAYLTETANQLWVAHRKKSLLQGNRDRRIFLAGVMSGFLEKLDAQSVRNREEGLVWVRDADLDDFYRRRHPHIRNVRHAGTRKNAAFSHGREAGKRIVLRKGVNAASDSRGHLLPSRKKHP